MTPEQIKSKYALPDLPIYFSEVHVPADTRIRVGIVNPNFGGEGTPSAIGSAGYVHDVATPGKVLPKPGMHSHAGTWE